MKKQTKKVIILSIQYIFFMLIAIGLLMNDISFCGAVLFLAVFGQSTTSMIKDILRDKEALRNDKVK